jgi:hypothetical protein
VERVPEEDVCMMKSLCFFSVCNRVNKGLQFKQMKRGSHPHIYRLKARETKFGNWIKGIVQLKQKLTSKQLHQLQLLCETTLTKIHRSVAGNVPNMTDEQNIGNSNSVPGFLVEFSEWDAAGFVCGRSGTDFSRNFTFHVEFDSLQCDNLMDIPQKLYNSLRIKLHRRFHELCLTTGQFNCCIEAFSIFSGIWTGQHDMKAIDQDGVLQLLGISDFVSEKSIDSWKMLKPRDKSEEFCYSLMVNDNNLSKKRKKRAKFLEGMIVTKQEITDLPSVEAAMNKSLKQLDLLYHGCNPEQTEVCSPTVKTSVKNMSTVKDGSINESASSSSHQKGGHDDIEENGFAIAAPPSEFGVDGTTGGMTGESQASVNIPNCCVTLRTYSHCCYKKREKSRTQFALSFVFATESVDMEDLDDISFKIYMSQQIIWWGKRIRKQQLIKLKDVVQKVWNNECNISMSGLITTNRIREKGIYWCEECNTQLGNRDTVAEHVITCHSKGHEVIKPGVNPTCPICRQSYLSYVNLLQHRIRFRHHSCLLPIADVLVFGRPSKAKYTSKHSQELTNQIADVLTFGRPSKAKYKSKHSQELTNQAEAKDESTLCSQCGKQMHTKKDAERHKLWHSKISSSTTKKIRLECSFCSKRCPTEVQMKQHMKSHQNEDTVKVYSCQICSKSFKNLTHLNNHMKIHSDVRDFACPECGQEFRLKHHLQSHMRRHTGDLFECRVCQRTFTSKAHLRVHTRDLHPQEAEFYPCKICQEEFSKLKFLNKHIEVEHMSHSNADDSDRINKTPKSLYSGLFRCDHCNAKFTKKYYVKQHILSEHMDPNHAKNKKMASPNDLVGKRCTRKKTVKTNKSGVGKKENARVVMKKVRTCFVQKEEAIAKVPKKRSRSCVRKEKNMTTVSKKVGKSDMRKEENMSAVPKKEKEENLKTVPKKVGKSAPIPMEASTSFVGRKKKSLSAAPTKVGSSLRKDTAVLQKRASSDVQK